MEGVLNLKISTKEMALVSIFTALTAIGAGISIPIGEVPITMQSIFVILSGIILGPKLGALSQIVYVALGLIGLPVFANFTGGLQSILKPSFGFIIGFIFAAYIAGKISHSDGIVSKSKIWMASISSSIVIYMIGLPYMYYMINISMAKGISFEVILKTGFLIFLPGDILKFIVASLISIKVIPILKSSKSFI